MFAALPERFPSPAESDAYYKFLLEEYQALSEDMENLEQQWRDIISDMENNLARHASTFPVQIYLPHLMRCILQVPFIYSNLSPLENLFNLQKYNDVHEGSFNDKVKTQCPAIMISLRADFLRSEQAFNDEWKTILSSASVHDCFTILKLHREHVLKMLDALREVLCFLNQSYRWAGFNALIAEYEQREEHYSKLLDLLEDAREQWHEKGTISLERLWGFSADQLYDWHQRKSGETYTVQRTWMRTVRPEWYQLFTAPYQVEESREEHLATGDALLLHDFLHSTLPPRASTAFQLYQEARDLGASPEVVQELAQTYNTLARSSLKEYQRAQREKQDSVDQYILEKYRAHVEDNPLSFEQELHV